MNKLSASSDNDKQPMKLRLKVCSQCERQNQRTFNHCWRCGSSDHFSRGCRKKSTQEQTKGKDSRSHQGWGHGVTSSFDKPYRVNCDKTAEFRYKGCHAPSYCSGACQRKHRIQHRNLCVSIGHLQWGKMHVTDKEIRGTVNNVFPSLKSQLVNAIDERCSVTCKINYKTMSLLWDTGSQVSFVNGNWLKSNFPAA